VRTGRALRVAIGALLFLGVAGCRRDAFPGAPVVLISIDTLRADHLPAYGYAGVETPALEAFRKEAVLFEAAYTHVPLTLPAHASVLTGRLPAAHGIHDNLGYTLSPAVETLPSFLGRAGYSTGGAISAIVLASASGISRGFDFYDDAVEPTEANQVLGRVQRAGDETAAALETWVDGVGGKPFLAFLHVYEPHSPYAPPEPWKSRYASEPYDGEIAAADAVVGRFLGHLRAKGLYDRSVVVVFSDHGEALGDHGEDEHGVFLYRETTRVPLMIRLPGGRRGGERIASMAALVDLFPTVASLVGLTPPKLGPEAVALLGPSAAPADPGRHVFSETFFPRIHLGWSDLAALTSLRHQYVAAPRPELYDLGADPGQTRNLAASRPPELRSFTVEMEKVKGSFVKPGAVDREEAAKLAALGYVSAGGLTEGGDLPDPKDAIGSLREVKSAFGLFTSGRNEEAAKAFEALLAGNPRMLDVWDAYSQALFRLGRGEEALAALRKGIEHSPGAAPSFLVSVAGLCLSLGKLDDAEKHALLAREKGDPTADEVLSRIYLAKRDLPKAEEHLRLALRSSGVKRLPFLTLARIEVARGNLPAALAALDQAQARADERKLRPILSLHHLRGDILGRMERPREAEAELLEEIRLFPMNGDAYASLAILYGAEGRLADARRTAGRIPDEAAPTPAGYAAAARVLAILGDRAGAADLLARGRARFPDDRRFRDAPGGGTRSTR